MNSPSTNDPVFKKRPGILSLALFWGMLFVACGLLGVGPYIGFYMFVLGSDDLDILFSGMLPFVPLLLAAVTFIEVFYQWLLKSSLMQHTAISIFFCSITALFGTMTQYVLPFENRLDVIGTMFGFEGRHLLALVCEFSAASLSIMGGIIGFNLSRSYLRQFLLIY